MPWIDWYDNLAKPSVAPSPSVISLIWLILYPVILVSFGFVFVQTFRGKLPWRVALPPPKNLVANLLFMPIFAGLRNVPLAAPRWDSSDPQSSADRPQKSGRDQGQPDPKTLERSATPGNPSRLEGRRGDEAV